MVDDSILKRWEKEYIEDIDIDKRFYINIDIDEMKKFIKDNYFDSSINKYVIGKSDIMLMGLQFLDYSCSLVHEDNINYLLCVVPNSKKTLTILCEVIYHKNCMKIVDDQKIPVTLLEYSETNQYFRNLGLHNELLKEFSNIIPYNQGIVTTSLSYFGYKCHLFDTLEIFLRQNGYDKDMRTLSEIDSEYESFLQDNPLSKKLANKNKS